MKVFKPKSFACEKCGCISTRKSGQKVLCEKCNADKIREYKHTWYMKNRHKSGISKRITDETGNRYGRLTVVEYIGINKYREAIFKCKCDCGNEVSVRGSALRGGRTRSCGCLQKDKARSNILNYNQSEKYVAPTNKKHGGANSKLYKVWCGIKARCYQKGNDHYDLYGGRGIYMCDEWKNDFAPFRDWAEKNGYSDNLTIDRVDVNGNYSPDNCRWITQKGQVRNRRVTLFYEHDGVSKPFAEWCEEYGVPYKTAWWKYRKGRSFEEIFDKQKGVWEE